MDKCRWLCNIEEGTRVSNKYIDTKRKVVKFIVTLKAPQYMQEP